MEELKNSLLKAQERISELEKLNGDLCEELRIKQEMFDKLSDRSRLTEKLLIMLTHDLRTPFSGMLGFIELLNKKLKKPKSEWNEIVVKTYLSHVDEGAKRLFAVVEDLFFWIQTRIKQLPYSPREVSPREIVNEVIILAQTNAKPINIINIIPAEIIVLADTTMLRSILQNLLTNALKFTHVKGQIIFSSVAEEHWVEVSVTDNGVGISPENLSKIFSDEFFTTPGTLHEKGTGFGLSICKDLVEAQGGKISVKSEEGRGSIFRFTIPRP
jgi:signal transduction histidine kinase